MEQTFRQCHGCKAQFPQSGLTEGWRYGVSSPECWQAYGILLAYDQNTFGFPPENRLIVDTYAVQHPQNPEYQKKLGINQRLIDASVQSVGIHLIALYSALVLKKELTTVSGIMSQILSQNIEWRPLDPPECLGAITIVDFSPEVSLDEYKKFAAQWAQSAWDAWAPHHKIVEEWYDRYGEASKGYRRTR